MAVNPQKIAALVQQKQAAGIMFKPAAFERAVLYPLDVDTKINLLALYTVQAHGKLPNGAKLSFMDGDRPVRVQLTSAEVEQLGDMAFQYVAAISAHADAMVAGEVQWSDPWPSNAPEQTEQPPPAPPEDPDAV